MVVLQKYLKYHIHFHPYVGVELTFHAFDLDGVRDVERGLEILTEVTNEVETELGVELGVELGGSRAGPAPSDAETDIGGQPKFQLGVEVVVVGPEHGGCVGTIAFFDPFDQVGTGPFTH